MQGDESAGRPRVSVLMAVFNAGAYLRPALESVLAQTFVDFELIAVDDGSGDDSRAVLEQCAREDERVRLVLRENRGLIDTRNELLAMATAPLVAWMDSDDISLPERLELQVARFDADPELVCLGTCAQCIDPGGHPLNLEVYPQAHGDILEEQKQGGAMRFPTTMMRRSAAARVGGFRKPFLMGEDFDFLLRLSEHGKMANLPDVAYLYRKHLRSTSAKLLLDWAAYRDVILELARERAQFGRDRLDMGVPLHIGTSPDADLNSVTIGAYVDWSRAAAFHGNRPLAFRYARSALRAGPLAPRAWKNMARLVFGIPAK